MGCDSRFEYIYKFVSDAKWDKRDINTLNAANPRAYRDNESSASSSYGNVNGHIIRWKEAASNPAATQFIWDIYLFGAETDDGAFTETTNCMLLAVVPGEVGDGKLVNITNTSGDGLNTKTVTTRVGNPGGGTTPSAASRPRSSTIVITKKNGGIIGL